MIDKERVDLRVRLCELEKANEALGKECLALKFRVRQLEDVVKQRDAEIESLTDALEEAVGLALRITPHPTHPSASEGQPGASAGEEKPQAVSSSGLFEREG